MSEKKYFKVCEQMMLGMSLKFFRSPFLEKRIVGLNDIKETIERAHLKEEWDRKRAATFSKMFYAVSLTFDLSLCCTDLTCCVCALLSFRLEFLILHRAIRICGFLRIGYSNGQSRITFLKNVWSKTAILNWFEELRLYWISSSVKTRWRSNIWICCGILQVANNTRSVFTFCHVTFASFLGPFEALRALLLCLKDLFLRGQNKLVCASFRVWNIWSTPSLLRCRPFSMLKNSITCSGWFPVNRLLSTTLNC